jgi:hypothetical protein
MPNIVAFALVSLDTFNIQKNNLDFGIAGYMDFGD